MKTRIPTWQHIASRDPDSIDRILACRQSAEAIERTSRILDRVMPLRPAPGAFHDPEGFIASSRLSSHRKLLARSVMQRIRAKIAVRDANLTLDEKVSILSNTTVDASGRTLHRATPN
jgi:hypothetical protein